MHTHLSNLTWTFYRFFVCVNAQIYILVFQEKNTFYLCEFTTIVLQISPDYSCVWSHNNYNAIVSLLQSVWDSTIFCVIFIWFHSYFLQISWHEPLQTWSKMGSSRRRMLQIIVFEILEKERIWIILLYIVFGVDKRRITHKTDI